MWISNNMHTCKLKSCIQRVLSRTHRFYVRSRAADSTHPACHRRNTCSRRCRHTRQLTPFGRRLHCTVRARLPAWRWALRSQTGGPNRHGRGWAWTGRCGSCGRSACRGPETRKMSTSVAFVTFLTTEPILHAHTFPAPSLLESSGTSHGINLDYKPIGSF